MGPSSRPGGPGSKYLNTTGVCIFKLAGSEPQLEASASLDQNRSFLKSAEKQLLPFQLFLKALLYMREIFTDGSIENLKIRGSSPTYQLIRAGPHKLFQAKKKKKREREILAGMWSPDGPHKGSHGVHMKRIYRRWFLY